MPNWVPRDCISCLVAVVFITPINSHSRFRSAIVEKSSVYDVKRWMMTPCPGPPVPLISVACQPVPSQRMVWFGGRPVHPTHRLIMHRGLFVCDHCGATGSTKIRLLREPCTQQLVSSHARDLQRIRAGVLPWGRVAWPM